MTIPFLLPFSPGTVSFFVAHALGWALATTFLLFQRKHAWESSELRDSKSWRSDWAEPYPVWAFDGALCVHLIDVPMALLMAMKLFSSSEALEEALTLSLNQLPADVRYGSMLALEHCIFASHFGIFLGDLVVHWSRPDLMFVAHHICSMILLALASLLGVVPGVISLAFCTSVMEIGSMSYCAWVVWRSRTSYIWLMTLSNIVYFTMISGILLRAEATLLLYSLVTCGVGLIIGRMAILIRDMRRHAKVA